ncbi:MAG TPA: hypothetical protein VNG93_05810 [Candidatus Dormibacteraeota bacterium]|nr:hypothetical protein [Candidatus Dormibacteraeota bacterium]
MTLYDIIADLRREHGNETASKTLDLVMLELGHNRDNLRAALGRLDRPSVPPGGEAVIRELDERAHRHHLDNLNYPEVRMAGFRPPLEPVDTGTAGIAILLGLTSLVLLGLAAAAVVAGLNSIYHFL